MLKFTQKEMEEFLEKRGAVIETKIETGFGSHGFMHDEYTRCVVDGLPELGTVEDVFNEIIKNYLLENA